MVARNNSVYFQHKMCTTNGLWCHGMLVTGFCGTWSVASDQLSPPAPSASKRGELPQVRSEKTAWSPLKRKEGVPDSSHLHSTVTPNPPFNLRTYNKVLDSYMVFHSLQFTDTQCNDTGSILPMELRKLHQTLVGPEARQFLPFP